MGCRCGGMGEWGVGMGGQETEEEGPFSGRIWK